MNIAVKPARMLHPLTSSQREIWFDQSLHAELPLYNVGGYVDLSGPTDPVLFKRALTLLVQKHDALRTILTDERDEDGVPLQTYPERLRVDVPLRDFSAEADPEAAARAWMQARFEEPFELYGLPLLRYDLLKLGDGRFYWLFQYHQLIIDGPGMALLNRSLATIYSRLVSGKDPDLSSPSYRDYIDNDRAYVDSAEFLEQRAYWLAQYPELPEPLLTPRHRTEFEAGPIGSGDLPLHLPCAFSQRLKVLAQTHGVTLLHVLLGVLYVYFTRTSRRDDVVVDLPVSNRNDTQSEETAGLFAGICPLRFGFARTLNFAGLLHEIDKALQAACRHQRFPVSELNRAVGLPPERARLFDVRLVHENHAYEAAFDGTESRTILFLPRWEQTPLSIHLRGCPGQADLELDFVYNRAYFEEAEIRALQGRFLALLEAVVDDSSVPIRSLPVITGAEREQLIAWNRTEADYARDQTLVSLFERQAAETPDAIAVVFENRSLTYAELNAKANRLAHYLLGLEGADGSPLIRPDTLVAIAVERSLEMVLGLLGILKAGAAYVPIDTNYPEERVSFLLEDSAALLLLTRTTLLDRLPQAEARRVLCLDGDAWTGGSADNPPRRSRPEHLAYVIYTSGSTGKPKGVAIEHRSAAVLINWAHTEFSRDPLAGVLASTSICFDLSVFELFVPLSRGGCVLLVENALHLEKLDNRLQPVTLINTVPSVAAALIDSGKIPDSVSVINLAGEPLKKHLADALYRSTSVAQVYNLYGPSEDTTYSTFAAIAGNSASEPTIGRPIANTRIYILDSDQQPLPPGIPGELCIAGDGLARGYLNRPELTAEKFVELDLFGRTERIYKTGDLARWLPDGNLEFLGRIDHQVKLRGFRIELGEIESVLSRHAAVREAVVALYQGDGNPRLAAYVTAADGAETADLPDALKTHLKACLPDYMVPAHVLVLDALPLTPNGKIDRKALPAPEPTDTQGFVAPATPTEELLAGLWAFLLRCESVGRRDNFFLLGGHSLLATQLVARMRACFQVELPIRAVFEHPELAGLAEAVDRAQGSTAVPPIVPQPAGAPKVLSFAQQRLWFLAEWEDAGSATYNMPMALSLEGKLDIEALRSSLAWLLERHESLRLAFPNVDGRPQVVVRSADREEALTVHDLTGLSTKAQPQEVQCRADAHAVAPFDLSRGPLFKADLLVLGKDRQVLLLNLHHICGDGWSWGVFMRDWRVAYTAFAQGSTPHLPGLALQYSDYAAWQREWLPGEVFEAQMAYWRTQLAGSPVLLELPTDRPRPPRQSYRGAQHLQRLASDLCARIQDLSRNQGVTLFMTLMAAFSILLARYSRQNDLCIGTPIANRTHQQTEDLIGFFVNTLVLRSRIQPEQTFTQLLAETRRSCLDAYAHQDLPFDALVEHLQPQRSPGHSPLFQVMFVLQNNELPELALPGLSIEPLAQVHPIAMFDLTLEVEERDGALHGRWEYATDLFAPDTIERLAGHFEVLLEAIVTDPEQPIGHLPLLTAAERQQLIAWNRTETDYPRDQTIVNLFERRAAEIPDHLAVVCEDRNLTYAELNTEANRLAHRLRGLGAGPGARVALCLERSPELIVGLLAVLKAGAAYVPLDPAYPGERLAFMLADSRAAVLLTQASLLADLPQHTTVLCLDKEEDALRTMSSANSGPAAHPDSLAYIIYTSGSSGQPKGVCIPHRGVVRLVCGTDYVRLGRDTRIAHASNPAFDAATFEIWGALLNGGAVVPVARDDLLDAGRLAAQLRSGRFTTLFLTTSLFNRMAGLDPGMFRDLDQLLVGGEAADPASMAAVLAHGRPRRLLNGYGPTESTTFATCFEVAEIKPGAASVPIGRPIANTTVYVLDGAGQRAPVGVPGELCIGGDGLAHGYLNRPELTAEKFVELDLFGRTERIYKTGDLARWLPDGNLEFLGRIDHQVKLRGFRIELGEIESVLSRHTAVREAVVALYQGDGNPRLAAYVTAADGAEITGLPDALKTHLKACLPDYMVPAHIQVLDALPLTPNGKADRKALPVPEATAAEFTPPATPTEQALAQIWTELLGLERIGRQDRFFDLGGHSLLATQLAARVRARLGAELPIRTVFEAPVLADLAARLDTAPRDAGRAPPLPPLCAADRRQPLPLSFAQQRLWFLEQRGAGSAYSMPFAFRLKGALDAPALQRSLQEIVRRHESLRTTFGLHDGQPVQRVGADSAVDLPHLDLSCRTPELREAAALEEAQAEALRPFDLGRDRMLRAKLLRLGEDEHVLLLSLHHIAADGWSVEVLWRELAALYAAFSKGLPSPLPELPIQYADFAVWQRQHLQGDVLARQLAYWKAHLEGAPPLLELPTDRPRPAIESFRGQSCFVHVDAALTAELKRFARQAGTTLFTTLLAAYQVLLARYAGRDDIIVGVPFANRTRIEIEPLIGFFVNTLALRADLSGNPGFRQVLEQAKRVTSEAQDHQDLPFERLVEELKVERALNYNPLVQVMFALQTSGIEGLALSGLEVAPFGSPEEQVRIDLELHLWERGDGLEGICVYAADLFDAATVERMLGHFRLLLERIVADPEQPIGRLPLLTAAERQQLIAWNRTETDYPRDQTIVSLFERRAAETPDHLAVVFEDRSFTYAELNVEANRLAHYLLSLEGADGSPLIRPDSLVAIAVERSLEMVAGLLGILKAGAAYVPLDPAYPRERLAFMLADCAAPVLLTQTALLDRLPPAETHRVLCLDGDAWTQGRADNPPLQSRPEHLAYVIYTSGSTGKSKGVMVEHRSVVNLTVFQQRDFRTGTANRVLQFASLSFDVASWEMFTTLCGGATLYLASLRDIQSDLSNILRSRAITHVALTPSVLGVLPDTDLPDLAYLTVGGELCPPDLIARWAPGRHFINAYGPTEATVCATVFECRPDGQKPPIGRPIDNTRIYLLDAHGQPLPPGIPGELCIAGDGLARGYWNRPELTAEKFVELELFGRTERIYKTGDLARWLPDGNFEFLGRIDHQVKLRGFRIELGEIESVLSRHTAVREAVVALYQGDGNPRLAAYITAADGAEITGLPDALKTHLKACLPDYMVPAHIQVLDALPLTPNGKADRKALPVPEATAAEFTPPATPTEQALAQIWAELLGLEWIGRQDRFFDLGGHSLLATQLATRVRARLGAELPIRTVFERPELAGLAEAIDRLTGTATLPVERTQRDAVPSAEKASAGSRAGSIPIAPRNRPLPLSFIQEEVWRRCQSENLGSIYHQIYGIRLEGALEVGALRRSLNALLARHEILRTTYPEVEGVPVQAIAPAADIRLPLVDLSVLPEAAHALELERRVADEDARGFDLMRGPLLRATLLRLREQVHLLLIATHHIFMDGWSVKLLLGDLGELYGAFVSGRASPPPPVLQYADYAYWQRQTFTPEMLASRQTYWQALLSEPPPPLNLPTDAPRPPEQSEHAHATDSARIALSADLTRRLKSLGRQEDATFYMILTAAYAALLYRYSGSDDIVIGAPTSKRSQGELEQVIGHFAGRSWLRIDLSGGPNFLALLARTRLVVLAALENQSLSLQQWLTATAGHIDWRPSRPLRVRANINLLPAIDGDLELPGLRMVLTPVGQKRDIVADLTVTLWENASPHGLALEGAWQYRRDLFEAATAARMVDDFRRLLEAVAADPAQPIDRLLPKPLFEGCIQ